MIVKYLKTKKELLSIYPLIRQHHASMKDDDFADLTKDLNDTKYKTIGCYQDEKLVATVGFWIGVRFYCGRYMYVNNFVVDKSQRGNGIGSQVMTWLEKEAKKLRCNAVVLDSYVTNHAAHKFYLNRGYIISNFHFKKDL